MFSTEIWRFWIDSRSFSASRARLMLMSFWLKRQMAITQKLTSYARKTQAGNG